MTTLREGALEYVFEESWIASKYDEWPFYREHFESALGGNKAVDVVAHDTKGTLWLIEIKDYRQFRRTKTIDLCEEVAVKVRDSLAGIFAAATWHSEHPHLADAQKHLSAKKVRVVLHLEQPGHHTKLFPRAFNRTKLQQRLKQLVNAVDPHPLVVELASFATLPWSAVNTSGEKS